MRRLAIIPTVHHNNSNRYLSAHGNLFEKLKEHFGFETIVTDKIDLNDISDAEIVFTFKSPQHSNPDSLIELAYLKHSTKLVTYFDDLQTYNKELYIQNMERILKRADIVLTCYWEAFIKMWPEYEYKTIHFPHFFAPDERYTNFQFNENPTNKCLLTGMVTQCYHYRTLIKNYVSVKHKNLVDVVDHPGYCKKLNEFDLSEVYVGDKYTELLHSYLCGIATSSKFQYVVAKFFEIPATGSLLLCNEPSDLAKIGFIKDKHYVALESDVASLMTNIVENPNEYRQIRIDGMNFVRQNHSINNRIEKLKEILEIDDSKLRVNTKIKIGIVYPQCFESFYKLLANAFIDCFASLGYEAFISHTISCNADTIINLCPLHYGNFTRERNKIYIMVQIEQFPTQYCTSQWQEKKWNDTLKFLNSYDLVWDSYYDFHKYLYDNAGCTDVIPFCLGYHKFFDNFEDCPKKYDTSFFGSTSVRRQTLLSRLNATFFGSVNEDQRKLLINETKINLNLHYHESTMVESLRIVVFMLSSKAFVLTEDFLGEQDLKENNCLVVFNNDNMVEKANYYLSNENERIKIAENGYNYLKNNKTLLTSIKRNF